jgi:predicted XRE-type DNA-binding protein
MNEPLRALLAAQLCEIMDGWIQVEAGGLAGVPQSNISRLRRGDTSGFSVDRLLRMIQRQGYHVDLRLIEMARRFRQPRRHPLTLVRRYDVFGRQVGGSREQPELLGGNGLWTPGQ